MKKICPITLAKQKDSRAMKQVIEDHYVLLCSMAHKIRRNNDYISHEDLVAEGSLGLIIALDKFDVDKKITFSTYAYYWIKNKMLAYLKKRNIQKKQTNILYNHFQITDNHLTVTESGNEQSFIEINNENLRMKNYAFEVFLNMVPEQQREVIILRKKNYSLKQISNKIQLSSERIRQIEKQFVAGFQDFVKNTLTLERFGGFFAFGLCVFWIFSR